MSILPPRIWIAPLCLAAATAHATPVGFWRLEEAGAAPGGAIGAAVNSLTPGTLDGAGISGAVYSADVPAPFTFDPISGVYHANQFSLNAGAATARVSVPNNVLLDTVGTGGNPSFTAEMFIKVVGEPVAFDTFMRRLVDGAIADTSTTSDRQGWQFDMDSGTAGTNYGRARSRFDMPGTPPPDFNRVSAVGSPRLFVDTATGSGNPADYPATGDVQLVGDGLNDLTAWHHFALTYDGSTRQFRTYLDGAAGTLVTLNSAFIHPAASLEFGKFAASTFGMVVDEVRYSAGVLTPAQFLQASVVPEPSSGLLALLGLGCLRLLRRRG